MKFKCEDFKDYMEFSIEDEFRNKSSRIVIEYAEFQEYHIKRKLIEMGWIPPKEKRE